MVENEIIVQKINQVIVLEEKLKAIKEIETQIKEEKEDLRQSMIGANLKSWETPNGTKITLIEDAPDEEVFIDKVDTEKFYEENTELVDRFQAIQIEYTKKQKDYTTTTTEIKSGRKGYVRITLPKSE